MMLARVENGTGAGVRRPKKPQPQGTWTHRCDRTLGVVELKAHWISCPDCGCPRT